MKQIFVSSLTPEDGRFQRRLWIADVLDLALGGLLGWGALRANDLGSAPGRAALVVLGAWVAYSTLCGAARRTVGRWLLGVDLVAGGRAPGPLRSFARAFTVPAGLILMAVFHSRPLDRSLGLRPEREEVGPRRWIGLFAWQVPWIVLLALAIQLVLTPTRSEALKFLSTLDGWRCCHARGKPSRRCVGSLERAVRAARAGDAGALEVVSDCPEAARWMPRE